MVQFKVIKDLKDLPEFNPDIEAFCDIETQGLYINTRLVQIYQPETSELIYVIDIDYVDLDSVKEILAPLHTVWQGCAYDFGTLNMTTAKYDDTLYLARSAYPEWQTFTLDDIVSNLGMGKLYSNLDKKKLQKAGFVLGAYLSQEQLLYSATDVYALSLIWKNPKIQKARELMSYKLDIISLKYSIQYQQNNLISNQAAVRKELDDLVEVIASNEKALGGLNSNSPKQVKEYLGVDSSAKEVLIKLITDAGPKAKMAQLVYDQRRLLKRRTFLNSYNFPYVTTRFNPAGAATGRFTSTGGDLPRGINAQQITRNLQYIFNSDTEDTTVIHADYSTAELRAGCAIMQDTNMYNELKQGLDLHKIAATLAIGGNPEDVTKADRQKGKAISFGFIFGMSAPSFQEYAYVNYGVIFTQEECKDIKQAYTNRYPQIAKYHKKWWNDYKSTPVSTPLGRKNMARLGTDAINFATQGCIADTAKLAVHYLCTEYSEAPKYIYNIVHDAIYLRVPKGIEELWANRLAIAMKKGWAEMCKASMLHFKDIPMPVEVEYTLNGQHIVKEF